MAILLKTDREWRIKALSAKDAKYNFGRMIDTARVEAVVIEKHGRPVVVVMAVEEYEPGFPRWLLPIADNGSTMGIRPRIRPRAVTIGCGPLLIGLIW